MCLKPSSKCNQVKATWISVYWCHFVTWQYLAPYCPCNSYNQPRPAFRAPFTYLYSPDLVPNDLEMFRPLKKTMGGKKFCSNEEVEEEECECEEIWAALNSEVLRVDGGGRGPIGRVRQGVVGQNGVLSLQPWWLLLSCGELLNYVAECEHNRFHRSGPFEQALSVKKVINHEQDARCVSGSRAPVTTTRLNVARIPCLCCCWALVTVSAVEISSTTTSSSSSSSSSIVIIIVLILAVFIKGDTEAAINDFLLCSQTADNSLLNENSTTFPLVTSSIPSSGASPIQMPNPNFLKQLAIVVGFTSNQAFLTIQKFPSLHSYSLTSEAVQTRAGRRIHACAVQFIIKHTTLLLPRALCALTNNRRPSLRGPLYAGRPLIWDEHRLQMTGAHEVQGMCIASGEMSSRKFVNIVFWS
ncbi:hypothetical protein PR048_020303 [Dryococelus australis]|uniref:Uncharacterized protein n=1 Tax=Dryococelus australis TaxID=614101 RepID=A0ABQ9H5W9_9NEOP|nr:hypothetical protein PR048_020303 [Dryococelus australis]